MATHINEMLLPREQAESLEAFYVIIEPGKYTHSHVHDDVEQLYYVISGEGEASFKYEDGRQEQFNLRPEDVVFVPRCTEHQIFCTGETQPLTYLCIDGFPNGKPSEEPTWDDHYKAILKLQAREDK